MELVRTALGDLVEHRAADAVFGRERRGGDLNFLHGFEDQVVNVVADGQLNDGAVEQVVGVVRQVAVDGDGVARVVSAAAFRHRL